MMTLVSRNTSGRSWSGCPPRFGGSDLTRCSICLLLYEIRSKTAACRFHMGGKFQRPGNWPETAIGELLAFACPEMAHADLDAAYTLRPDSQLVDDLLHPVHLLRDALGALPQFFRIDQAAQGDDALLHDHLDRSGLQVVVVGQLADHLVVDQVIGGAFLLGRRKNQQRKDQHQTDGPHISSPEGFRVAGASRGPPKTTRSPASPGAP